MNIFELAAELGRALKEDKRLIALDEARVAYENDETVMKLMMEYEVQQRAMQNEAMKTERRQIGKAQREAEEQRRFELKQQKKKEKKRGH